MKRTGKSEHLSVHLGVAVGNSVLSVSATGSYDKRVLENTDVWTFCCFPLSRVSVLGYLTFFLPFAQFIFLSFSLHFGRTSQEIAAKFFKTDSAFSTFQLRLEELI